MLNVETLYGLCSVLQIMGFLIIVLWMQLPNYTGAFISVTGFAAVVKVFLPVDGSQDILTMIGAAAGVGIICLGVLKARDS